MLITNFLFSQEKLVIDDITLDEKIMTTIMLADAKKINSKIKVGDILEEKVSPTDYGYNASSQVKQRFNEILNRPITTNFCVYSFLTVNRAVFPEFWPIYPIGASADDQFFHASFEFPILLLNSPDNHSVNADGLWLPDGFGSS